MKMYNIGRTIITQGAPAGLLAERKVKLAEAM